jgi:hypothetical protein
MPVYEFFWESTDIDEKGVLRINANIKRIEKLLDKFRNENENYDIETWFDYLKSKGLKVEVVNTDYYVYF